MNLVEHLSTFHSFSDFGSLFTLYRMTNSNMHEQKKCYMCNQGGQMVRNWSGLCDLKVRVPLRCVNWFWGGKLGQIYHVSYINIMRNYFLI